MFAKYLFILLSDDAMLSFLYYKMPRNAKSRFPNDFKDRKCRI